VILLKCAADHWIERLEVMGDSKLLMDWDNRKIRIENLGLGPIMLRVSEVKSQFSAITFSHIFREFNVQADSLSKDALSMREGIRNFIQRMKSVLRVLFVVFNMEAGFFSSMLSLFSGGATRAVERIIEFYLCRSTIFGGSQASGCL
jgi:hypothetical protein